MSGIVYMKYTIQVKVEGCMFHVNKYMNDLTTYATLQIIGYI